MRFTRVFIALALLFFIACKGTQPDPKPTTTVTVAADMVIKGGTIYTLNPNQPTAEALAILDGRILKIGSLDAVEPHISPKTEVIQLNDQLVIPGLIEGHGHFLGLGHSQMNLRLADTQSWQDVIDQVAQAAETTPAGSWILGRGWHQEKWTEQPAKTVSGFPTHDALSAISPDHPVLLNHASGHAVFANAKAMELAGITNQTPNPPGGEIIRDDTGRAIGLFNETAESLVRSAYQTSRANLTDEAKEQEKRQAISLAAKECLAKGITSFQDAGSTFSDIDLFQKLVKEQALDLRLWVMLGENNANLRARGKAYVAPEAQSDYLVVGGIKRYIDGALGSRGAWLLKPYEDEPQSTGHNVMTLEELEETARIAQDLGIQLCTHAIGDRGNREVLDLYSKYVTGKDLRWRIEHAQHLNPADISRFAELGVVASMQGIHCTSDAPFVEKRLGAVRAEEGAYVWRKLLETGAMVNNGTDAPVEDVDPLPNLQALVTRQPKTGEPFYPKQALTIHEALKAYTLSNAYATFQEAKVGTLEEGKWADITILSKDITALPASAIADTKVVYTLVGGVVKHKNL